MSDEGVTSTILYYTKVECCAIKTKKDTVDTNK